MEVHNLIRRGSWTHVQTKTTYLQQINWKDVKSKGLTLLMVDVTVSL
jgi:hypothetical protein